jgi:glucosamine--fructose-6-phosphate aminotransferase (isomerizing)
MGYVGPGNAWPMVLAGLKRLEYRGYDSAGIATISRRRIRMVRKVGPIAALEQAGGKGQPGKIGIGHTRWATHGGVTEPNCHPHLDDANRVALVHNGIVDNIEELRAELVAAGIKLKSETDSEILAQLVGLALETDEQDLVHAVRRTLARMEGTAGLIALDRTQPDRMVAARIGSPVVIGLGANESWVASDPLALLPFTDRMVVLDDGELAEIRGSGFRTVDLENRDREKRIEKIVGDPDAAELGDHEHFMLKEILEQPAAITRGIRGRLDATVGSAHLGGFDEFGQKLFEIERVVVFGCGTSLLSAQVGRFQLERWARMPATAEDAAEFAASNPIVSGRTLYVAVSQSGETADTLAAIKEIHMRGGVVAGITNVAGSSVARATDFGIYLHAGPEISVCSTKAFTAQVLALNLLALRLARTRDLSAADGRAWVGALEALPTLIERMLNQADTITTLAESCTQSPYVMFTGRGANVAVAGEGALKLKEIAYIPSDGLSGAAMKHGPLALISEGTPVWALVPPDETRERMLGNLRELEARGARVFAVADENDTEVASLANQVIPLPAHHPVVSPILCVVPLQLFAYHTARGLGLDIDKPRNLAKAVTVM